MIRRLTIATLLVLSAPIGAQVADPILQATDPADRAVSAEIAGILADPSPDIARLDAALLKVPRPTPMRGMVQASRAAVLAAADKTGPAVSAIEEALRLLPDNPLPKVIAAAIFTFSGSPQRAADLWLQASLESPDVTRQSDRYYMMALVGRLSDIGDRARADRISARLGEIGFSAGLAPERSEAALARVREAMRLGKTDEALVGVTAIGDPDDLLTLYIDKRYQALWPRIGDWAGPDLMGQARRYLEELRGDWTAADTYETATPYARRLANLRANDAVVALFAPMLTEARLRDHPPGAELLAPVVARSLAVQGRAAEAKPILARMAVATAGDRTGNALNVDAGYLTLATLAADWPETLARADAFLAAANALGPNINRAAISRVRSWRACALSRLGRADEARADAAALMLDSVALPDPAMDMLLCRGDATAARALVIARLEDEQTRDWALGFVQPTSPDNRTPGAIVMGQTARAVRTAPDVVAAANRVGRIMPAPMNQTLPTGFDPFRAPATSRPLSPGDT